MRGSPRLPAGRWFGLASGKAPRERSLIGCLSVLSMGPMLVAFAPRCTASVGGIARVQIQDRDSNPRPRVPRPSVGDSLSPLVDSKTGALAKHAKTQKDREGFNEKRAGGARGALRASQNPPGCENKAGGKAGSIPCNGRDSPGSDPCDRCILPSLWQWRNP
jgi:hypothetical protein